MQRPGFLILLLNLLVFNAFSQGTAPVQDITGLWKGTLYTDTLKQYYQYEIGISEENGKLSGFSHTWFILDDKQYYGVKKVKITRQGDKIIIEDAGLIANNYPVQPAKGVHQLNVLELNATDSIMKLTGSFTTNANRHYSSLTGTIYLERKNDYWQSALVPHLQELNLTKELSFVKDDFLPVRNGIVINRPSAAPLNMKTEITKPGIKKPEALAIPPVKTEQGAVALNDVFKSENKMAVAAGKNNEAAVGRITSPAGEAPAKVNQADTVYPIGLPTRQLAKSNFPKEPPVVIMKENNPATIAQAGNPGGTVAVKVNHADTVYPAALATPPVGKSNIPREQPAMSRGENNAVTVALKVQDKSGAAFDVFNRTTLIEQTVVFKSDSLQLSLYDNGEVDGDTVSVLMNGNIIMSKERLSTNAVRKTIYIPQTTDTVQLVMYAENLGTIPPNTGLLVVKDGKDIYEIRFSGDLQKNAAIILKRKRE